MSGIVGVIGHAPVNQLLYDAVLLLQHRGQDAAGITTQHEGRFYSHAGRGMARDVFRTRNMRALPGNSGLAQVCYTPSSASDGDDGGDVPPFYASAPFGLTLAYAGQLTNDFALRRQLLGEDRRHLNSDDDGQLLLGVLAHELEEATRAAPLDADVVFAAVTNLHRRVQGAYSVIVHIAGFGMLVFRDPFGIRPLCFGRDGTGSVMVASESVALEGTGHALERDVAPGEALLITLDGHMQISPCAAAAQSFPCIFEYVYLARPDSVLDGISVYQARLNLGKTLAKRVISMVPPGEIDVVIPVPESSRPSANELARLLGKPYREGLVKNRYIGRTFIMPGQAVRQRSVRQKLNVIGSEFAGRKVLLVDDSIVRGTTSMQIVQMARQAGAAKVWLASAAPPVCHPNVYGIDMPTRDELVAHGRTPNEMQRLIGADALIFQDLAAMKQAVGQLNPALAGFESSCFDGHYIAGNGQPTTSGDEDPRNE